MAEAETNAKLEISPSVKQTTDGAEIVVNAVLTNTGSTALWVNKRMLFNTVYAPKNFREIWFDVKSPGGKMLEFQCKVKAGAARPEHYVALPAGESVNAEIKLSRCFDMKEKGNYQVQAHYQDGNKEVPPAPADAKHLAGELQSAPIKVAVE